MIENNRSVNNWILRLSGGRDSRLAVNLLYRLGIKNVICYSYGHLNNEQSRLSKQVAEALGYKWFFVEYTEGKWFGLHENGLFDDYINYSFNGTSTHHLQDFLAVYELTKNNIIVKGDVFVKSYGDFIAGNHFLDTDINVCTLDQAIERIIRQHVKFKNKKNNFFSNLIAMYEEANMEYKKIPDHFNWQERQAKLMVNSIRVYEYIRFKCQLPFWDKENVHFWLQISADQRVQRNMFLKIVQNLLEEELINIPRARVVKNLLLTSMHGYIVKLFPMYIINYILKATGRKVYLNEGMNLIFALKSPSVKDYYKLKTILKIHYFILKAF